MLLLLQIDPHLPDSNENLNRKEKCSKAEHWENAPGLLPERDSLRVSGCARAGKVNE